MNDTFGSGTVAVGERTPRTIDDRTTVPGRYLVGDTTVAVVQARHRWLTNQIPDQY